MALDSAATHTMAVSRLETFERRFERIDRINVRFCGVLKDRGNPLETLDDVAFVKRYRLTKEACVFVFELIKADVEPVVHRGTYVPGLLKLLVALRFYASGTFQINIGDLQNVSQQFCSKTIKLISTAIAKKRGQFIRFPNNEEAPAVRAAFQEIAGFPGVTGAIDCTHVVIDAPGGPQSELYRNRKGRHSLNVQAICGPNLEITSIVTRWYGSAHDSRIFDNSNIKTRLMNNLSPGRLIGDQGYPCLKYLMTPLRNPTTAAEIKYNKSLSKTRVLIERVFGILKRLFPALRLGLRLALQTDHAVIISCAILYNIRKKFNMPDPEPLPPDDAPYEPVQQDDPAGFAVRRNIIDNFFAAQAEE